ncbi:hypothetical protein GCM10023231_36340 [Olivibacter ginsenosidimutans]|uniref:PKD-like domain-containing protein n=1 Tax=Olivibacter ginsenosidimutans TaxID=1176537 RepID=A0ABP9C2T2_9SPHI
MCSASYAVNNLPSGATIAWNITCHRAISGSSNQNTVNVIGTGNAAVLKAIITGPCIGNITLTKTIYSGAPTAGVLTAETGASWGVNRIHASIDNVQNATSYNWYLDGELRSVHGKTINFLVEDCNVEHTVEVEAVNSCGTSARFFRKVVSWCGY